MGGHESSHCVCDGLTVKTKTDNVKERHGSSVQCVSQQLEQKTDFHRNYIAGGKKSVSSSE